MRVRLTDPMYCEPPGQELGERTSNVDVESPRTGTDTMAGKAADLVAQLTVDDSKEPDRAQLDDLSAMLVAQEDHDMIVEDTVCALYLFRVTSPCVDSCMPMSRV